MKLGYYIFYSKNDKSTEEFYHLGIPLCYLVFSKTMEVAKKVILKCKTKHNREVNSGEGLGFFGNKIG